LRSRCSRYPTRSVLPAILCASLLGTAIGTLASATSAQAATAPVVTMNPAGPYVDKGDGQNITISVSANNIFVPRTHVQVLECADRGGTVSNLPISDATCDGNTIQGETILVNANGSISPSQYTVFELPNFKSLEEPSTNQPVCNATHACVLLIAYNQNVFTQPHIFSAPFIVSDQHVAQPSYLSGSPSSSSTTVIIIVVVLVVLVLGAAAIVAVRRRSGPANGVTSQ
jgi:hypothetical protein